MRAARLALRRSVHNMDGVPHSSMLLEWAALRPRQGAE